MDGGGAARPGRGHGAGVGSGAYQSGANDPGHRRLRRGAAQTVVNTPIDVSKAIAAFPGQTSGSSGLANFFHGLSLPSWPTLVGSSPYPSPSSFPSTQYPNFKPVPFVPIPGSPPPTNIAVQHIGD